MAWCDCWSSFLFTKSLRQCIDGSDFSNHILRTTAYSGGYADFIWAPTPVIAEKDNTGMWFSLKIWLIQGGKANPIFFYIYIEVLLQSVYIVHEAMGLKPDLSSAFADILKAHKSSHSEYSNWIAHLQRVLGRGRYADGPIKTCCSLLFYSSGRIFSVRASREAFTENVPATNESWGIAILRLRHSQPHPWWGQAGHRKRLKYMC